MQKRPRELIYPQFGLPRTPLRSLSPGKVIPASESPDAGPLAAGGGELPSNGPQTAGSPALVGLLSDSVGEES